MDNRYIIIFDGICNFCNNAVQFIIKRDPQKVFVFTPMQSAAAKDLMLQYHVSTVGLDTVLLIKNEVCYIRSSAVLEITKDLTGFWSLFRILLIVPVPVRDFFYKMFARHRYNLFGRRESCMIATADILERFLE